MGRAGSARGGKARAGRLSGAVTTGEITCEGVYLRSCCRRSPREPCPRAEYGEVNAVLRGHYAYYGVAGNIPALFKVYRAVQRYWRKMLCSRSWAGRGLTWDAFNQIKERTPLLRPKLHLPYGKLQALAVL